MGNRMPKKITVDKEKYRDKVYACWLGKNLGGTIGGPYEGRRETLNVTGFATAKGEPLPNDDLDLQLVWLMAVEERGARIDQNVLAEYWLTYVTPFWNEYGICKNNLASHLLPPLSGEFNNPQYKHSNGAWIRTEIWACLYPGFPALARKYSFMDACVDHGMGEGTYSAMYVAALESAAFFESDIKKLVISSLKYIPENCVTAKCIKLAVKCYEDGKTAEETRNAVLEAGEVGGFKWFMAPANIGYVVIGLLYGGGDFKKSMLTAVNCGDDTDCTAATVGSILGIVGGTKIIPADWRAYIGDRIITKCINGHRSEDFPQSCKELTDRVIQAVNKTMNDPLDFDFSFSDRDDGVDGNVNYKNEFVINKLLQRKPLSFDIPENNFVKGIVEFDRDPILKKGETLVFTVRFYSEYLNTQNLECKVVTPDGITAEYNKNVFVQPLDVTEFSKDILSDVLTVTLTATGDPAAQNIIVAEITSNGRAHVAAIPITILG